MRLRIPGPTECPQEVLEAMGKQMINHRGPEFAELMSGITERLKTVFQTENDILTLTCSGTGGLEAAIVNFLSLGEKILATTVGNFGNRFAEIARRHGAETIVLAKPWGEDVTPEELDEELRNNSDVSAVLITHNETSTGVTNDLRELARVAREHGKLILVDAVSSMAAIPVQTDEWELDVVVTASQKGFMCPPGLAMISVSERAWRAHEHADMECFYLDLGLAKKSLEKWQTPSTPAVSNLFALDKALELILREGLKNVFLRHERVAEHCRNGISSIGWPLFAKPHCASDAVTAVTVPPPFGAALLIKTLREKYGVVVAGGMKELSGKIIRIGHVGKVDEGDIDHVIHALKILSQKSFDVDVEYT
ncbi:MAG: alanine--glyoxylate aminotransferase family protein [Candidatus Liptonbacteria bacterium]|nr:alanine--glyoxylate aminotransferase family protein [Candidatus Liptonbacteria bacterium]